MSHVSPDFIPVFGDAIRMTRYALYSPQPRVTLTRPANREVLLTTTGQPFLISGSGTLGWDQVCLHNRSPAAHETQFALCPGRGELGRARGECLGAALWLFRR